MKPKQVAWLSTRARTAISAMLALVVVVGCGGKGDQAALAPVAKVNKVEVTQGQVDLLLQQQRNLRPDQWEGASRQILDRLVDQQLVLQKADETKLDRDPRVMQMLEMARREVLVRAYLERVAEAAPKPSAEDVKKYFDEKPVLFSERRVFSLQEVSIEARPEQVAELREKLQTTQNFDAFVEHLKGTGLRFVGNQVVRAAEQLPFGVLEAISRLNVGQALLAPNATGAQVFVVLGSRPQPATEEQARPAIEQYILGERKRKLVEDAMKELKSAAKVEYLGKFASAAGSAPTAGASASAVGTGADAKK